MYITVSDKLTTEHTVTFYPPEGGPQEALIKYHALFEDELRKLRKEGLTAITEHMAEGDKDTLSNLKFAIDQMDDDVVEDRRQLLMERILDWNIKDGAAEVKNAKLPCTDENKRYVLRLEWMLKPLYEGLLTASSEGQRKNSRAG